MFAILTTILSIQLCAKSSKKNIMSKAGGARGKNLVHVDGCSSCCAFAVGMSSYNLQAVCTFNCDMKKEPIKSSLGLANYSKTNVYAVSPSIIHEWSCTENATMLLVTKIISSRLRPNHPVAGAVEIRDL